MAIVLKFKQGDSGTELNLNAGATGFQLSGQGWSPSVATPVHMGDPGPVVETIHLLLAHTNQNNIAASMQSLHEMQVLADRYINDLSQENPVWLHAKMANETGERRALVYSMSAQYKTSWFGEQATALDIPLVLTVVRGPYWESTTVRNLPDAAPSAAACVVYNYTAAGDVVAAHDIVGDVGARLRLFTLYDNSGNNPVRFWMGIRSANKHGADGLTNFEPIWECESGTNNASESGIVDAADATASGGNRVQVVETDLDWDETDFKQVLKFDINDVTANEEDQLGNFLWLLRAKVTAGTWEVRLTWMWTQYADSIPTEIVEISDTDWRFYEMAINPIPFTNIHSFSNTDIPRTGEDSYLLHISARRTSGSGNLYLDCINPIPIDEGFCKLDFGSELTNGAIAQSPEGYYSVISYSAAGGPSGIFSVNTPDSIENFALPPGDGRIYCSYERTSSSVLADTVIFNDSDIGRYYER
jgi:hypothetical protein